MDIVISARVPEDAIRILKENKIKVSEIVRTSIITAAQEEKLKESKEALAKMAAVLKKIPKDQFMKSIREDRDETH